MDLNHKSPPVKMNVLVIVKLMMNKATGLDIP